MPRVAKELSAAAVRNIARAGKPGIYAVGGVAGLALQVGKTPATDENGARVWVPSDSRCWVLRTHIAGQRRSIGLGPFPEVGLAAAREKAREIKEQIRAGRDPLEQRRAAQAALMAAQAPRMTFERAARAKFAAIQSEFTNKRSRDRWIGVLERYAFPVIGSMDVADIALPHVVQVLEPIWHTKTETATRCRAHIESTLAWATVSGYREGDNPARWRGNLAEVLPKPRKITKVTHQKALPWAEVPAFMAQLRTHGGMAARALEFAILTAARSGEVRHATWDEIDWAAAVWRVPADRTKMGRPHNVPLSDDAVALLQNLPRYHGSDLVFPNSQGRALSDAMLSKLTRTMGGECVPHGFRSSFKDWARQNSSAPDEVSELALAHVGSDATRAAYARDELLPQRRRLMIAWATFLATGEVGGNVHSIEEAQQ